MSRTYAFYPSLIKKPHYADAAKIIAQEIANRNSAPVSIKTKSSEVYDNNTWYEKRIADFNDDRNILIPLAKNVNAKLTDLKKAYKTFKTLAGKMITAGVQQPEITPSLAHVFIGALQSLTPVLYNEIVTGKSNSHDNTRLGIETQFSVLGRKTIIGGRQTFLYTFSSLATQDWIIAIRDLDLNIETPYLTLRFPYTPIVTLRFEIYGGDGNVTATLDNSLSDGTVTFNQGGDGLYTAGRNSVSMPAAILLNASGNWPLFLDVNTQAVGYGSVYRAIYNQTKGFDSFSNFQKMINGGQTPTS